MLVGCKTDLAQQRVVEVREAERFAARHGVFFMETSAADGTNVQLTATILRIRASYLISTRSEPPVPTPGPTQPPSMPTAREQPPLTATGAPTPRPVQAVAPPTPGAMPPSGAGTDGHASEAVPDANGGNSGGGADSEAGAMLRLEDLLSAPPSAAAAAAGSERRLSLTPVSRSYRTISGILGRHRQFVEQASSPSSIQELAQRLIKMSNSNGVDHVPTEVGKRATARPAAQEASTPVSAAANGAPPAATQPTLLDPPTTVAPSPAVEVASSVCVWRHVRSVYLGDHVWCNRPLPQLLEQRPTHHLHLQSLSRCYQRRTMS